MATKLVAGSSQFRFLPFNLKCPQEFLPGLAREVFQIAAQDRTTFVLGQVRHRQPRGDHAKRRVERSQLTQERLEGRLTNWRAA